MKKKLFKRLSAFVLAGAMVTGMTTNVIAVHKGKTSASDGYSLMTGVNVTYSLQGWLVGEVEAASLIVSDYEALEISVSVYAEAEGLYGSGYSESLGSDYEENITISGDSAEVVVYLSTPADAYFVELTAYSEHTAGFYDGIDALSDSCELDIWLY